MGRPQETAALLQEGLSPAKIAERFGVSFNSVVPYLWVAVGYGLIRRSDVLFSFPKELRREVDRVAHSATREGLFELIIDLRKRKVAFDLNELQLLWNLTAARAGHGDLYEFLTNTEKLLHETIREVLVGQFGKDEAGWWRQGVPEKVRADCAVARERDDEGGAEPFAFTTFIHLQDILHHQWPLFQNRLPKEAASDKKAFLADLKRLNAIRNRVMHPTRLHMISDEDFEFAREMHRKLRLEAWRAPSKDPTLNVVTATATPTEAPDKIIHLKKGTRDVSKKHKA